MSKGGSATLTTICLLIRPSGGLNWFEVDLFKALDIASSYSVNDITDISKPKNHFSKNVELSGTPRTNKALQYVFRVDVITNNILDIDIDAQLLVNGVDILYSVGVLQVTEMRTNETLGTIFYECDLTGGRFRWVSLLDKLFACDLPLGSHIFDDTTTRNSWDRKGKLGVVFDHTFIGAAYFPVHYGWFVDGSINVNIQDLRPHVYIAHIFQVAFAEIGYTLKGDYINSNRYKGLMHMFTRGAWDLTFDQETELTAQAVHQGPYLYDSCDVLGEGQFMRFDINNGGFFINIREWEQPIDAEMEICVTVDPGQGIVAGCLSLHIEVNAISVTLAPYIPISGINLCITLILFKDDIVKLRWVNDQCLIGPPPCDQITIGILKAIWDFRPTNPKVKGIGSTIELCETMDPKLTVKNILDGVTHLENLYWETNESSKEVTVSTATEFYRPQVQEEWSDRVDCGRDIVQEIDKGKCRNFVFSFKKDSSDAFVKIIEEENLGGKGLYSGEAIFDPSDICREESINPTYSPTWNINRHNLNQTSVPPAQIQWLAMWKTVPEPPFPTTNPEELISHDFAPRICYYEGLIDEVDAGYFAPLKWEYDPGTGIVGVEDLYPHAYMVDYYNYNTEFAVSYGDVVDRRIGPTLQLGVITVFPGIISNTYAFLLGILDRGRSVEIWCTLTESQIHNLDFTTFKIIRTALIAEGIYLLNEVKDWQPEDLLALCEFYLVRDGV